MNRRPAEISARMVVVVPARRRGGELVRINARHTAEARKLAALKSSAAASPAAWAARPAAPRPQM
jgi:hypothetical protein